MAKVQPSTTPGTLAAGSIGLRNQHKVSWREHWSDDWQLLDYYECTEFTESAAPTIPSAKIIYKAGMILREDGSDFAAETPTDLTDCFVKIEVLPEPDPTAQNKSGNNSKPKPIITWYGIVPSQHWTVGGGKDTPVVDCEFQALGLEYLLDLVPIKGAFIDVSGVATQIDTPLVFNERFARGLPAAGNRVASQSHDSGAGNYHAFTFDMTVRDPAVWCIHDAVNYLLTWYNPQAFDVTIGGQQSAIDALKKINLPRTDLSHLTVLGALNELLDARRGFGWRLRVAADSGGAEQVELDVFTVCPDPIVANGFTIPANPNKEDLDVSTRIDTQLNVGFDASTSYGTIIVSGERILSCFSVSFAEGTLERCWTDTDETKYATAAGKTSSDANWTRLNELERIADAYEHVWSHFRIKPTWQWKVGQGDGTTATQVASPEVKADGSIDATTPADGRTWGLRLERSIPFVKSQFADNYRPEYREPLVLIKDPTTNTYMPVHALNALGESGAIVRMLDNDLGIEVRTQPPHLFAVNDFHPTGTVIAPKYDYKTIIATVAVRTDRRLEVTVNIPKGDSWRVLHIEVPDAELWYCVPNTILDTHNGTLIRQTANPELRNDKIRLQQIAAMAKVWYSVRRAAMELLIDGIADKYPIGTFIKSVAVAALKTPVNAPVTTRTINLRANTTRYLTGYAAPEFSKLV